MYKIWAWHYNKRYPFGVQVSFTASDLLSDRTELRLSVSLLEWCASVAVGADIWNRHRREWLRDHS